MAGEPGIEGGASGWVNPGTCESCGQDVPDRCNDDFCEACHKSLGFGECKDGSWVRNFRAAHGL